MTADAVAGAEEKYKSEGFIDYIAKSFTKNQIKIKLDNIFKDNNITIDDVSVFNSNEDRFKDVPAYVIEDNHVEEITSEEAEELTRDD